MMGSDGGMAFGGLFMWAFWLVLIVLIVVVVKALTGGTSSPGNSSAQESPLDILRKRFARGEIDKEEFERRRRELEQ